ncbi:MAG: bacillithiol biosynthesis deacetylase BshB1 [bacterium]|nr:bacillithiol biosynthesis deacetylase BshB1 [bacterium]
MASSGNKPVDILAIGPHPDDCEMTMGGTLLKMKSQGYKIGICDLTLGEMGTYGTTETRKDELKRASELMGLDARVTLDLPDGSVRDTQENRLKMIEVIRRLRPELVFSFVDRSLRHPDHIHCARLVRECCFLAGLQKLETESVPFRPSSFIGYPELTFDKPDFVIDITDFWERRQEVIRCYNTQVTQPGEDDSQTRTFIRSNRFWEIQEARATMAGAYIGVRYGEPFFSDNPPQLNDPLKAFQRKLK